MSLAMAEALVKGSGPEVAEELDTWQRQTTPAPSLGTCFRQATPAPRTPTTSQASSSSSNLIEPGVDYASPIELAVIWVEKGRKGSSAWVDRCPEAQVKIYRFRKRLKH